MRLCFASSRHAPLKNARCAKKAGFYRLFRLQYESARLGKRKSARRVTPVFFVGDLKKDEKRFSFPSSSLIRYCLITIVVRENPNTPLRIAFKFSMLTPLPDKKSSPAARDCGIMPLVHPDFSLFISSEVNQPWRTFAI